MSVVNGSTQVPLRWNYTLSSDPVRSTFFSVRLIDGSLDIIGEISGGNPKVSDRYDYRTRFGISGSELATLIIKKVTVREEAVYLCNLQTDSNLWGYSIRVIVTGEHCYVYCTNR